MTRGSVSRYRQASIAMDREGQLQPADAVLDTGFTGYLTLPPDSVRLLGSFLFGLSDLRACQHDGRETSRLALLQAAEG